MFLLQSPLKNEYHKNWGIYLQYLYERPYFKSLYSYLVSFFIRLCLFSRIWRIFSVQLEMSIIAQLINFETEKGM